MCEGDFFTIKGQAVYEAGIYRDTLNSSSGCDSIVSYIITVEKAYYNYRIEHILEGDSVLFFNEWMKTTGVYTHYGQKIGMCDSTSVLQLVVHPLIDTVVTVCSTSLPYPWVNKWTGQTTLLYAPGTYRNDTSYVNGEKIFYGLQLKVTQPSDTTIYRTICEGDVYSFNGRTQKEAGEYRDTLLNAYGCDSIIVLKLNVLKKYHNITYHSIFEGDSVEFLGQYYKEPGSYPVRYTSSYGCDSVMELQLTVNRLYDDSISVCSNELPFIWNSKTIYESGVYRDTVVNSEGRKTAIGIKVTVLPISRAEQPLVAMICEGDYYKFGEKILTAQGTYYDTLTAVNGCDSIVMLALQVMPVQYQSINKRIFEGDSALFNGTWYKESGVYEYRETNSNGCTDTYQLILTVLKTFNVDTVAVVCKNDLPYIWRGYEFNESGEYTLPIAWTDSSRVVKTLHLKVNDVFYGERNVSICAGDKFVFKGLTYTESGEVFDTIPSMVGCDSIVKYIISVHPTYDHVFEKHISDKQPYVFHDRVLTLSGTYEWTGKTINGCDSMEHLFLTVHPSFFQADTIDVCQSDTLNYPYIWEDENGRLIASISQTGVYYDSVLTEYGFDSVHQLVVNVHPAYLIKESYEIGVGEHLKIHGKDISNPAVYFDTLRTIHGCDSIFHVVVNLKRTREFTWNKEICQGEYFQFLDGRKLTQAGVYKYTSQYKDSVVTLNLSVNPITVTEDRVVVTDNISWPYVYKGRLYPNPGVYEDSLLNQYGCFDIKRTILVTTSRYSAWTPMPLCPGSPITIDGKVITEAGLYTFVRRSRVTGEMDSLFRVEVYEAPSYELNETRVICDGDTIFYADSTVAITRGGHYDLAFKTRDGCDSLVHLDLTVNPSYRYYEYATTRDYIPYTWLGRTYTQTGIYDRTWPTDKDCDSTYTLDLTVVKTIRDTLVESICVGQAFNWRGQQYSEPGYYIDTVWRPATNFSAIYSLQLSVAHPTVITSARMAGDVCADAESFDISFNYEGQKPTHYSVYFDQLAKQAGFQDIIDAPLPSDMIAHVNLPRFTSVAYQNHPYYIRPDYYTLRLALDNGVCGISRSDSLKLLVKYPSWIIEQNWTDVVAPLKAEYNGGFDFAQTEWYVNGVLQPNTGAGYLHSRELRPGDQVVMMATRVNETVAIPSCPLTIITPTSPVYSTPVIVYPALAPRQAPDITIEARKEGMFEIYSSTGLMIDSGTFSEGQTSVAMPSVSGIYFIRTHVGRDTQSHKVLIY